MGEPLDTTEAINSLYEIYDSADSFYGQKLEGKSELLWEPESEFHKLKLTQLALDPAAKEACTVAVSVMNSEGETAKFVLATLRPGKVDQYGLTLEFEEPAVFSLVAGKGPVHLIGNELVQREAIAEQLEQLQYYDSDDEDDSEEDEDFADRMVSMNDDESEEDTDDEEGPKIEELEDDESEEEAPQLVVQATKKQVAATPKAKKAKLAKAEQAKPVAKETPKAKKAKSQSATPAKSGKKSEAATPAKGEKPTMKQLLEKLSATPNKPKKESKFKNFCKNNLKVEDSDTLNSLWTEYSKSL